MVFNQAQLVVTLPGRHVKLISTTKTKAFALQVTDIHNIDSFNKPIKFLKLCLVFLTASCMRLKQRGTWHYIYVAFFLSEECHVGKDNISGKNGFFKLLRVQITNGKKVNSPGRAN